MKYRYRKNWHSPMIQDISLAVIVDSRIFLEVAEGEIYQTWKDDNIVDFWTFCDILSNQMIKYNPTHCKYEVEYNMRSDTHIKQTKKYKSKYAVRKEIWRPSEKEVQLSNFSKKIKEAKYHRGAKFMSV